MFAVEYCRALLLASQKIALIESIANCWWGKSRQYLACLPSLLSMKSVNQIQKVRLQVVVRYEECEMWRSLYSPCKLSSTEKQQLTTLEKYTFTWGANLSDLELPGRLSEVCVFLNVLHVCTFYTVLWVFWLLFWYLIWQLLRPLTSLHYPPNRPTQQSCGHVSSNKRLIQSGSSARQTHWVWVARLLTLCYAQLARTYATCNLPSRFQMRWSWCKDRDTDFKRPDRWPLWMCS